MSLDAIRPAAHSQLIDDVIYSRSQELFSVTVACVKSGEEKTTVDLGLGFTVTEALRYEDGCCLRIGKNRSP